MELREEVARVACEVDCGRITPNELARCQDMADAILSLPRIREALELMEQHSWTVGEKDPD